MEIISFISPEKIEYPFENVKWEEKIKTKTHFISSYVVDDIVVVSTWRIKFVCESCKKETIMIYSNFKKRKSNHCISCIRKINNIENIYEKGYSLSKIVNKITSKLYSYPVSLFSHHTMNWILKKWSRENDIVYDPAGGFGGRLLGTYRHKIKYITTDPFTFDDLNYINDLLDLNATIYDKKSEDITINCDLVVCCPPYYKDETYQDVENRSYDVWLKEYWQKTVNNISCKRFVLIIGEKYQEMIDIVSSKWTEKERFEIINTSFKSINKELIIYFEN